MKHSLSLLETTLILLLLWAASSTTTALENVLDIYGKPVLTSTSYYVVPFNRSQGSGITMILNPKNSTCPQHVALDTSKESAPSIISLKFLYFGSSFARSMYLDVDVNVVFDRQIGMCDESKGWRLITQGSTTYVKTGGEVGLLFKESDWFKIKKAGNGDYNNNVYKFVWCPETKGAQQICLNLGVVSEGGVSFLAVTDDPLLVQFIG